VRRSGMVRAGAVAAALALAGSSLAGCSTSSAAGAESFSSEEYDYTIELPPGWSALPAEDELGAGQPPLTGPPITDVMSPGPSRRVSEMELPALVIGAQPLPRGTAVPAWERVVTSIVRYQKGCAAPASTEPVHVGEEEGVLLAYPGCPEGSGLDHTWIAAVHRNRGYHIVWFNRPGHEAADRKVLDQILASWQFDV
jgi:hypothetical protein